MLRRKLLPEIFRRSITALAVVTSLFLALQFSAMAQAPADAAKPQASAPATAPQSTPATGAGTQESKMPDWQIAAGGKMEFDIASIKKDTTPLSPQTVSSNVPLGPQDMYSPTGGLLSSKNYPIFVYLMFAYKLAPDQLQPVIAQLPKWATSDHYDIEARAQGNPTKDQFRLMMQALLADRFKLAVHYETKQGPVMALVFDKPGKMGPQLQLHPADSTCSTAPPPPSSTPGAAPPLVTGGFPESCGAVTGWLADGRLRFGGRNVSMQMAASIFAAPGLGVDRPVIDKTGISGKVDFVMDFTPQLNGPLPPGSTIQFDPDGPTLLEALKQQLGLKLESQTGPIESLVVDHIEQPSEN